MIRFFAHSENALGVKHDLVAHLVRVAELARGHAEKLGAPDLGYWAGLWHDLGKFHPDFQSYISHPEARRGPDHSSAGAVHAPGGSRVSRFWSRDITGACPRPTN